MNGLRSYHKITFEFHLHAHESSLLLYDEQKGEKVLNLCPCPHARSPVIIICMYVFYETGRGRNSKTEVIVWYV